MDAKLTRKEAKELKKIAEQPGGGKKKYSSLQKKARSEQRLGDLCNALEGGKIQQPLKLDVMDRKIARNLFRAKYGNRKMRQAWVNARVRHIGIVAYHDELVRTDPKGRHSSPKFPDIPQGSYAHDRAIQQRNQQRRVMVK
jgi:hypothetical protein